MSASIIQAVRGYELRQRIGAGGFGVVYCAFQPVVGREVAIKVIQPEYASQPEFIRRFEREAQLVARLEHPHIVPLYDFWRDPDGAYLVMRYLRGGNLRAALFQAAWPMEAAARLLEQIGGALAAAHRQGVIHRDLKPDNILLDEQQNAYLSDFGIAKDLLDAAQAAQSTGITGTPSYLSPEQARNDAVSPQSDLYSLGVVMYELLTGEHPFAGLSPATQMLKHLTELLPPLSKLRPDLPGTLNQVIQRATAKNPGARYPDAVAFAEAFHRAASLPAGEMERVSAQAPTPAQRPAALLMNPYKGLRAFDAADAADFFGRQALTELLLERLRVEGQSSRFLAVVGPSGSGKSSLVKAGVLPALRGGALPGSEKWFMVEMLPGAHPLDELEIGLLHVAADKNVSLMEQLRRDERGLIRAARLVLPPEEAEGELLLVVDQFEECFTHAVDKEESKHFLRCLWAAALEPRSRVRVMLTLRADFYDRPLMHPELSQLMRTCTEVVTPLSPEELGEAIQKPAERAGAGLEAGLVEAILADVREQPGALPMLQYALTELFERREGRLLTRQAYQEIGGVGGALARRAEETYAQLSEVEQAAARQLFLRLVSLGEGAEDTRRRVLQGELNAVVIDQGAMQAAIENFGRSRLLLFDRDPATREPSVEVAHEALLREWKRLKEWLDESRSDIRLQRILATAAQEWGESGREASFLLGGMRLAQYEGWMAGSQVALTQEEQAFLTASIAGRQAFQAEEQARQQRDLEAAQKLAETERQRATAEAKSARWLRVGVELVAVLVLVVSLLAVRATEARYAAQRQAKINYSLLLAANAREVYAAGDADLALALALKAVDMAKPPAEAVRMLANISLSPGTRRILSGHSNTVRDVAFSPDGFFALSGSCGRLDGDGNCAEGELLLWNLQSGEIARRLVDLTGWVNSVAFSPDGKTALSGSSSGTLILWNLATGERLFVAGGSGTPAINSIAFSADGSNALIGSAQPEIILWDVAARQEIRRFSGHSAAVNRVAFSPDGKTALSASDDTTLILWDVATGKIIQRFSGHTKRVTEAVFLPGGTQLASCSWDLSLRLWDVQTGEQVRIQSFPAFIDALAVDPSGRILIFNQGHELHLWDVPGWKDLQRLLGHTKSISRITVSPDGAQALSATADGALRLWNLSGQAARRRFPGSSDFTTAVAVSPDGRILFTGSSQATLWDISSGQILRPLSGQAGWVAPGAAAFSADGSLLLAGTGDFFGDSGASSLLVWEVASGREVCRLTGNQYLPRSVAFSPDGRTALTGGQDLAVDVGELMLWDAQTCQMLRRFDTQEDITAIAFNAAGDRALTASAYFSNVILWDVSSGQEIRRFQLGADPVFGVAFGPGEATVLAAVGDGSLTEWDANTGEILRRFLGHASGVWGLEISRDGKYVVSSSNDGGVILWDFASGQEVRRYAGHTSWSPDIAFSPDGRFAYSVGVDGSILEWQIADLPLKELIPWARANRYVRELTCEERARYRVGPLCGSGEK